MSTGIRSFSSKAAPSPNKSHPSTPRHAKSKSLGSADGSSAAKQNQFGGPYSRGNDGFVNNFSGEAFHKAPFHILQRLAERNRRLQSAGQAASYRKRSNPMEKNTRSCDEGLATHRRQRHSDSITTSRSTSLSGPAWPRAWEPKRMIRRGENFLRNATRQGATCRKSLIFSLDAATGVSLR